jgi:hypothetical protein
MASDLIWFKNTKKSILTYEDTNSSNEANHIFIKMIMDDKYLPEQAKIDFSEKFLRKFLQDNKYRDSVQGGLLASEGDATYIVFINRKYYGIVHNIEDTYNIGPEGTSRYAFQIECYK